MCSKNQIKSIRSFQKQILTFNFHDIGHGLKIADEQNVNGHSQICLEQWDNQLFGYLHEIFKWWLKTMTYLWSTPLNLSWISRKPELSKEIGNWWLGTILGQIWRLQCLARPLEHPWGRGILLQKLAASAYQLFSWYQNNCYHRYCGHKWIQRLIPYLLPCQKISTGSHRWKPPTRQLQATKTWPSEIDITLVPDNSLRSILWCKKC